MAEATVAFKELGIEVLSTALSLLCLREVLLIRQCDTQFRSLFALVTILQGAWIAYPLPARGPPRSSSSFTGFAKELHEWAAGSVLLLPNAFREVSKWCSNDLVIEELRQDHPGSIVRMNEAWRKVNLCSALASMFAQCNLGAAHFSCSDSASRAIRTLEESLQSVATWDRCFFETCCSNVFIDEDCGGGNKKETYIAEMRIDMDRGAAKFMITATYFAFLDSLNGIEGNESSVVCKCVLPEMHGPSTIFEFSRNGILYSDSDDDDDPVNVDDRMLEQVSTFLLGSAGNGTTSLALLWRLLCAPTVAWPRWETTAWRDYVDSCSHVAAELIEDEEPCARPAFLRFRRIFEMASAKVAHMDDFATASSSSLDDSKVLDTTALYLAGPPRRKRGS